MIETAYRSIKTTLPAEGTAELMARLERVETRAMHGGPAIVWNGEGSTVIDWRGNRFIDFTSGIFVANVGHANAHVSDAILPGLDEALHAYTYPTHIRAEYLEKLTQWAGFEKAFLVSSGTEATEAALKLMRLHGQRKSPDCRNVICFEGAFHGRTVGAQMMSGKSDDPHILHMPFPYPWLGSTHYPLIPAPSTSICGFMLETFQGWCAAFYPPDFVQAIERYCRQHDILICFDEMQAGFGRTGRKFGYEHYGVKPDLICVGKAMGGGLPLSGVLGRADILDLPEPGEMSSTHGGNPLCCAAGLAVIEEIERLNLVKEAERKGRILFDELCHIGEPYGEGLIAALLFKNAEFASKVAERCMQKGVLVVATGREAIKIGPPLVIPDEALIEGVSVIAEAIAELS